MLGHAAGSTESKVGLGVMLQDADPPDAVTVAELVGLIASFYPAPLSADSVNEIADLGGISGRQYGQLSGGQKRRVQLAMSFVGNPKVIILDEPTAHMDSVSKRQFWRTLEQLREQGKTVLLVTHQMDEVDALASRVIVMNQGSVVADGEVSKFRAAFAWPASYSVQLCRQRQSPSWPPCSGSKVLAASLKYCQPTATGLFENCWPPIRALANWR